MPWAWVSIGSNLEPETNIRNAIAALRDEFGELVLSPVYQTAAEGFVGDDFLNLVVGFESSLSSDELNSKLHQIEDENGRIRDGIKFGSRTLDLDLLTHGDLVSDKPGCQLPRDEILKYAFVLGPLAQVAPDERHPVLGQSYADLWALFSDPGKAAMHEVELVL